ncbi:MAG: cysteine desulfurase [Verrucomicrobiales bacterium]|nr:cysteine desulfurase [Verrucomicrobiales bacterium]
MDWDAVRAEFPILDQEVKGQPLVYLDNAATSQKPRAVIQALVDFYTRDNANVHRGLHELSHRATLRYEGAREKVAAFIGAASEREVIFTRGTTEAINLVAQAWAGTQLQPGDAILITGMEHHSNIVPWQLAAERSGAVVRHIPLRDDGTLDLEAARAELATGRVKLLSCTHISNSLGVVNPVADLCAMARAAGALSLVDAAQSIGHRPVSVTEIGCDWLVFSGHKMVGPTGIGVLWGREDLLNEMPPWQGGGEMISKVTLESSTFKKAPARFEAGTPPIAEAVGLAAAIDFLEQVGRAAIWEHDQQLTRQARALLDAVPGLHVLGPGAEVERGALLSFTLEGAHPHDVVTVADEQGVALRAGHHCTQPVMRRFGVPSTTRASFYFYNTPAEVERLGEMLLDAARFFQG